MYTYEFLLYTYEFLQSRSSDRRLCNTADSPCCEQKAAVLLLGSVRKRSALRGVLSVVQVVQHCTVISVSLIGFGQDGWCVEPAVQRCFGTNRQSLPDC